MLARRTLARDDGPPTAPAPAASEPIQVLGSPQAPTISMSRAWLEQHVPHGTTKLTGKDHPAVMRAVMEKLLELYPWAAPRRVEILGRVGDMWMTLSSDDWKDDRLEGEVLHSIFEVIDQLPPDAPVQVYRIEGALQLYVDTRTLGAGAKSLTPEAAGKVAQSVLTELEAKTSLFVLGEMREPLRAEIAKDLAGAVGLKVHWIDKPAIVFGDAKWREYIEESEADEPTKGMVLSTRGAGSYRLQDDLTLEEMQFFEKTMRGILGYTDAKWEAKGEALVVFRSDIERLRKLAADPDRLQRLAEMMKKGRKGRKFSSFAHMLETLDETLDYKEAAKRLKVDVDAEDDDDEKPIVDRPLHGVIVNKTGELVPGQQARFELDVVDDVDAWRVPKVNIKWVAEDAAGKVVDTETTSWVGTRARFWRDTVFNYTFRKPGVYKVHAFVNHNFFLPAHLVEPVEVRTERERVAHLDERSGFGKQRGKEKAHVFEDVKNEEVPFLDDMVSLPVMDDAKKRQEQYAHGHRSEGTIDADLLALEGGSATVGLTVVENKIAELERMRADADIPGGRLSDDEIEWLDGRIKRLEEVRDKFTGVKADKNAYPVHCQGSYVGRTNRAPTGPLTLVCWFTYDAVKKEYSAHLMDHSELIKAETYHLKARGTDYERTMEKLFYELTRTYPDGSMTFAFQRYEGLKATGDYVRFERVTDTKANDARDAYKSDETSMLVNILSVLLTVFPPTMALGVTIGLVYNASTAIDDYQEAARTGTLKAEHKVALGLAALDIFPALGRSGRLVRVGRGTFLAVDAVQHAGQSFLIAASVKGEIENIRDLKLTQLARKMDEIGRLRRQNASNPDIRRLEREAETLRDDIRDASETVFRSAGGKFLLQMAPSVVIPKLAQVRGGGAGDADVDAPTRPAPPDDPSGGPPSPKPPDKPPDRIDAAGGAPKPISDPALAQGLPAHLRDEVKVLRDESLHDTTVRVTYKLKDGRVDEITVRAGRSATAADVALHARTVSAMHGYSGLYGRIRLLLQQIKEFISGGGAAPPVGSRAWEAMLELDKLPHIIEARLEALAAGADPATVARLEAEIKHLTAQYEKHAQTWERMDLETGAGHVAAEGGHHDDAVKAGYPPLDEAPGHYYHPLPGGGFELRQRVDSTAAPMQLAKENGRWKLEKAPARPVPGLGKLEPDQAARLSDVLGLEAVKELSGRPKDIERALRVEARLAPLMGDPEVMAGIGRLMLGDDARKVMGVNKRLQVIEGVPDANLRDFLVWVGRDEWQHPHAMGVQRLLKVGRATDELRFMTRHGREKYNELNKPRKMFEVLLEKLRTMDDAGGDALVDDLIRAGTPVVREKLLGMPDRPPPRRASGRGRADTKDPRWPEYVETARTFLNGVGDKGKPRREHLRPGPDGEVDFEAAVTAYATVLQVSARVTTAWKAHQGLPYARRVRVLQELDDAARAGGLPDTWINNARGDVAEALFAPGGGRAQKSIPNPHHPSKSGGPGRTQLDGVYPPAGQSGARPDSDSPVPEWVEVKSDLIDTPGRGGRPNAQAVALAKKYAADGLQDWDALRSNAATRNDRLVIHFARKPDAATQEAMRKILFRHDSPFMAVGFGDVWVNRPKGDFPKDYIERVADAEAALADPVP